MKDWMKRQRTETNALWTKLERSPEKMEDPSNVWNDEKTQVSCDNTAGKHWDAAKKVWSDVKKWIMPGWLWTLLMVVAGSLTLFTVFSRRLQGTPFSYLAYCLSFYGLILATIKAVAVGRMIHQKICNIPITYRYFTDDYYKVRVGLTASFLFNLCYAGLRLVYAARQASFWDGALMAYYILLCAVRFYLIRRTPASRETTDYCGELSHYRTTGIFLLVLSLVLMGIATQIVRDGRSYSYPGTLIYAVALHAFYSMTLAIINVVKYRHMKSPVLSAAKAVNLTTAVVSLFTLETAMLAQFGRDAQFQTYMISLTGSVVCVFCFLQSIFILTYANRKCKQLADAVF